MVTEDYVSFEAAKLLKKKGFDEDCYAYWDLTVETKTPKIGLSVSSKNWNYKWNPIPFPISAPTLQRAMKWLRDIHNLGVFPSTYYHEINGTVRHDYGSTIVRLDTFEIIGNDKNIDDYTFEADTYEETADKAIRYCLENLI